MPQLDPSVFSPQLVWLAITFVVLYLIMARSALPKVANVLEERADRIADDLQLSEEMKEESRALEAEYEKSSAEARAQANRILAEARETLRAVIATRRAAAEAELIAEVAGAEDKIGKAKADAMEELEDMAVEACAAIVKRLTGRSIVESGLREAVKGEIRAVVEGSDA